MGIELPSNFPLQDLLSSLIGLIEEKSGAKEAYFTAFESAVSCGLGFWRIGSEYCDDEGTEQEIRLFKVDRFDSCWIDPSACKNDASDARFGFYRGEIPKDEAYQLIDGSSYDTKLDIGGRLACKDGFVPDVIYYEVYDTKFWRYYSDDGLAVWDEAELPEGVRYDREAKAIVSDVGIIPATRRRIEKKKCKVYRFVDSCLVAESVLDIPRIGIVRVTGDKVAEFTEENTGIYWTGAVNWLMSAQRQVNYHTCNELELSGNAPKAPWVAPFKAIENYPEWDNANVVNYSALTYDHVDEDGNPIPPPMRADNQAQTGPSMASKMQSVELMGRTIGISDGMLGESQSAMESGKLAFLRLNQGEISIANYNANLEQSIAYTADLIIDMIPVIYDTERDFVLDIGGKRQIVKLNLSQVLTKELRKYIKTKVASGPSYEQKRKEGNEALFMMASLVPEYAKAFLVPLIKATGADQADQVVKNLQSIDPALAPMENAELVPREQVDALLQAEAEDSAQLEAQLEAMAQDRVQLVRLIEQLQNELQSNTEDNATKIKIAEMNNQTKLQDTLLKEGAENQRESERLSADLRSEIMEMIKSALSNKGEIEIEKEESDEIDNENESMNSIETSENVILDVPKQTLVRGGTAFETPPEISGQSDGDSK
jgi:hypothetical protein